MNSGNKNKANKEAASEVNVGNSVATQRVKKKVFSGPKGVDVPLRVSISRQGHAELSAHARESLQAEVCGVLVGEVCRDDEGVFTDVQAIIRGQAASEGSTHVTFTQATWNAIHETMDRDHAGRSIVGWYHTHPGFGVEFSEMDLFIQKNFFSGEAQVALVTDPISGEVAVAANAADGGGITYLPYYWMDGREQPARMPASSIPSTMQSGEHSPATARSLEALENRVSQLTHALDEVTSLFYKTLFFVGGLACLGIMVLVGFLIRAQFQSRIEPPQLNNFVPVPVKIGDKNVMLGVGVVSWEVPPELNSLLLDIEKMKQEAAAAEKQAAEEGKEPKKDEPKTEQPKQPQPPSQPAPPPSQQPPQSSPSPAK
ncbi:MAG TPA: Mov34/MPN/PAD-1 family protein [Candidatus Saccharimonadia bacterium]|nr:Mov34/MPN/PAD-1 family protein [Candidatus Saccharimonadia bacterium]